MKTYENQAAFDADVVDGRFDVKDDVTFEFDLNTTASINALNINALNINARNITAGDIKARNITAWDITAGTIDALNINARNITAVDINAWDINFYSVACAHRKFSCKSIVGRRENSKFLCLDSEIIFKEKNRENI